MTSLTLCCLVMTLPISLCCSSVVNKHKLFALSVLCLYYRDHTCFTCINICRALRMLFEHEADMPSVQHHPRDPASVNAMKQTFVIVILVYFTLFQHN